MAKFVLTAQLQLQAPNNVKQVVNQIQQQLNGVQVNVQVQNAGKAQRDLNSITKAADNASSSFNKAGKAFATSVKRFSALAIATRAVSLFTTTLSGAIKESISFERELIKISQVTGKTIAQLSSLTNTITNLSTSLGVSSTSILSVGRILSQAGLNAKDTEIALSSLAKTELAPTFDDITQTAEGAVAILNQFKTGAAALEGQLGALNAVAGQFAVESGDLISVIRRTGGVFKAAGGDLNELIALFTSVRATTRESAESIATGLRTIFTRIQRPETIKFLEQFGVRLTDLEGKFVGPYEAVRQLSSALAGLGERDLTFIQVAEELGGFRQIGKVLPLLSEFATAQEALKVAQKGQDTLAKDAAKAQLSLAVQIARVKEEFLALVRGVTETPTFQIMARSALELASALIRVADSMKPLLPIITAIAAVKFTQGIGGFLGGIAGGLKGGKGFNTGGKVHAFATGGMVPGSGNRDTVPAMLTPGEFVIKKSSVQKLGAENLAAMNSGGKVQKFAKGAKVKIKVQDGAVGGFFLTPDQGTDRNFDLSKGNAVGKKITNPNVISSISGGSDLTDDQLLASLSGAARARVFGARTSAGKDPAYKSSGFNSNTSVPIGDGVRKTFKELGPEGKKRLKQESNIGTSSTVAGLEVASLTGQGVGFLPGQDIKQNAQISSAVGLATQKILTQGVTEGAQKILSLGNFGGVIKLDESGVSGADRLASDPNAKASVEGFLFEGIIDAITGATLAGKQAAFDFPFSSLKSNRKALERFFTPSGSIGNLINADAKRSYSLKDTIASKVVSDINAGNTKGYDIERFAAGGAATGTDTVPAMLTPGEFVVNKASAKRIGYGALNRMNKVGKYANGGVVQKFANGTSGNGVQSSGGGFMGFDRVTGGLIAMQGALGVLTPAIDENSSSFEKATAGFNSSLQGVIATATSVKIALEAFGVSLAGSSITKFFGRGSGSAGELLTKGFSKLSNTNIFKGIQIGRGNFGPLGSMGGSMGAKARATALAQNQGFFGSVGRGIGKASKLPGINQLVGFFGRFTAGLASATGPILAIAGIGSVVGGLIKGFRDLDGRLKEAIKAEDVATAQTLAVAQAAEQNFGGVIAGLASGLAPFIGDAGNEILIGVSNFFGGNSLDQIKANINAQIQQAKSAKAVEEANKATSEAMEQFRNGTASASDVLAASAAATAQLNAQFKALGDQIAANEANKSTGVGAYARNIGAYLGGGLFGMETAATRNKRIDKENKELQEQQTTADKQAISLAKPGIDLLQRQFAAAGGSFEDFMAQLEKDNKGAYDAIIRQGSTELVKQFKNLSEEAARTKAAFEAMNLGMRSVQAAAGAMTTSLNNYLASQEAGNISLNQSIATLEASVTSAAAGLNSADFESAVGDALGSLQELGGDDAQIKKFEGNLRGINAAQKFFAQASEETRKQLQAEFERGAGGPGTLQERQGKIASVIGSQLEKAGIAPEVKKRIEDAIKGGKLDEGAIEDIMEGNLAPLDSLLTELGEKTLSQVIPALKQYAEAQEKLVSLTKQRISIENELISAQKRTLDVQLEAAEIIAKYGGAAVTPEQRTQNIIQKANVDAQGLGVGGLRTGSAAEIVQRQRDINNRLAQIQGIRADAARGDAGARQKLAGESGARLANEEERLLKLNEQTYDTTKALIDQKVKEIELIKRKNQLEKSSIEALYAGDIMKFFEQKAAAGAQAAMSIGNQQLISQFDLQDMGTALMDLRSQREAGVRQVGGRDINDVIASGMAGVSGLTGVSAESQRVAFDMTPEIQAVESEIRSLARTLADNFRNIENALSRDLDIQDIKVKKANNIVAESVANVKAAGAQPPAAAAAGAKPPAVVGGNSRGGLIYASEGQYVNFEPKGTDTVPAMLTPGEFVVNAKSTKKYRSVLENINSGKDPQYASRGGIIGPKYLATGGGADEEEIKSLKARRTDAAKKRFFSSKPFGSPAYLSELRDWEEKNKTGSYAKNNKELVDSLKAISGERDEELFSSAPEAVAKRKADLKASQARKAEREKRREAELRKNRREYHTKLYGESPETTQAKIDYRRRLEDDQRFKDMQENGPQFTGQFETEYQVRRFESDDGRFSTNARLTGVSKDGQSAIIVKKDGSSVSVPFNRLSLADRDYVNSARRFQDERAIGKQIFNEDIAAASDFSAGVARSLFQAASVGVTEGSKEEVAKEKAREALGNAVSSAIASSVSFADRVVKQTKQGAQAGVQAAGEYVNKKAVEFVTYAQNQKTEARNQAVAQEFNTFVKRRESGELVRFPISEYSEDEITALRQKYPDLTTTYLPTPTPLSSPSPVAVPSSSFAPELTGGQPLSPALRDSGFFADSSATRRKMEEEEWLNSLTGPMIGADTRTPEERAAGERMFNPIEIDTIFGRRKETPQEQKARGFEELAQARMQAAGARPIDRSSAYGRFLEFEQVIGDIASGFVAGGGRSPTGRVKPPGRPQGSGWSPGLKIKPPTAPARKPTPQRLPPILQQALKYAEEAGVPSEIVYDRFKGAQAAGDIRYFTEEMDKLVTSKVQTYRGVLNKAGAPASPRFEKEVAGFLEDQNARANLSRTSEVERLIKDQDFVNSGAESSSVPPKDGFTAKDVAQRGGRYNPPTVTSAAEASSAPSTSSTTPLAQPLPQQQLRDMLRRKPKPTASSVASPPPPPVPKALRRPTATPPPPKATKAATGTIKPSKPPTQVMDDLANAQITRPTAAQLKSVGASADEIAAASRYEQITAFRNSRGFDQSGARVNLLRSGIETKEQMDTYFDLLANPPKKVRDLRQFLTGKALNSDLKLLFSDNYLRQLRQVFARDGITGDAAEAIIVKDILEGPLTSAGRSFKKGADYWSNLHNRQSPLPQLQFKSHGGMIYANNGMLVPYQPKGTDTVPAMLTPGEFVVNAGAVKRGNNLSLLKAINSGSAPSPAAMSRGGRVQYFENGGSVSGGSSVSNSMGLSSEAMNSFAASLENFNTKLAENITSLSNIEFKIALSPTSVNINLQGTEFLERMTTTLKQELMNYIGQQLKNFSMGSDGKLRNSGGSGLGTPL